MASWVSSVGLRAVIPRLGHLLLLLLVMLSTCFVQVTSAPAAKGAQQLRYVAVFDRVTATNSESLQAAGTLRLAQKVRFQQLGASSVSSLSSLSNVLSFTATAAVAQQIAANAGAKVYQSRRRYLQQHGGKTVHRSLGSRVLQQQNLSCSDCDSSLFGKLSLTKEYTPYGVKLVQADHPTFLNLTGGPSAFGVTTCILDTGVDPSHPDMAGNNWDGYVPSQPIPNCPFCEILFNWNSTYGNLHGQHVSGIVAAARNGLGVTGVISGGTNLYHVNLFSTAVYTTDWQIAEGLEACYQTLQLKKVRDPLHKMVVSMSLAGPGATYVEEVIFKGLYDRGDVLFVAAAGNNGTNATEYPASYDAVVSVAALDCNRKVTSFSTFNDDVELAAPGSQVFSTVPKNASILSPGRLQIRSGYKTLASLEASPAEASGFSTQLPSTLSARVVDCGAANSSCPATVRGNICLIDRGPPGSPVLCSRVRTCMAAGARVVLAVANGCRAGGVLTLNCTFFDPNCTCSYAPDFIPTYYIGKPEGQVLRANLALGRRMKAIFSAGPYPALWVQESGTSMATPHVAGLAAKLWNSFRNCSNSVIRQALSASALDLGSPGRDQNYGYGLVRGVAAAAWLKLQPCARG